jgi:hypothetical protein
MNDFQPKRGDRSKLTIAELAVLDGQIIPAARKWLREFPGLADHAVATLSHWSEPLVDDRGRAYTQGDAK